MLRRSRLHVAAFICTCCSLHVYMLQRSCLHAASLYRAWFKPSWILFSSNVQSVLLCGPETWRTTKTTIKQVQTFIDPLTFEPRYRVSKLSPIFPAILMTEEVLPPVFHGSTAKLFHPMFNGCITIMIMYYLRFKSVRTNNIRVKQKQRKNLPWWT